MSSPITHALLLTAGLGTRLRPLTVVRAKPAMPVAGEPLVARIIRWLVSHGVTNLVLNLHHRPETITRIVGDGGQYGARVRYSWESPDVLGSAGGPRLAAPIVGASPFLIVNGDTLTDVDLGALAAAHQAGGALVTMALVVNTEPERYGGVRLDDAGAVLGFVPRGPAATGSFHYIGVQVADAGAFAAVTPGETASSVGGVYDRLIGERPGSIRGWVCDARFWDIGTVADYWRTSQAFAGREHLPHGAPAADAGARIDPTASIGTSILWDGVSIGPHAWLDGCIVTDGVAVPAGAHYRDVILTAGPAGQLVVTPRPSA